MSTLSVYFLAVLMVSYVPVLFPGLPGAGGLVFTGLAERMLIAVDMILIATMAVSPMTPGAARHLECLGITATRTASGVVALEACGGERDDDGGPADEDCEAGPG